jgi:hypothetical protein
MSLLQTVGGLFTEEYERFVDGVRLLHPDVAEQELRRRHSLTLVPGAPRTVSVPGWDDVIHLTPRMPITDGWRTEYWSARRDRRAPNLAPDVVHELDRRRERVRAMANSATPGYLGGWQQILTALDNVQDFTATVSALGHLALWTFERLTPALERVGLRALLRSAPFLARIGARFIPGLGLILTVSDLLNLLSFLGQTATPLYALLCGGVRDAVAEAAQLALFGKRRPSFQGLDLLRRGVPAAGFKRPPKEETWRLMRISPGGRLGRFGYLPRAIGRLPRFSNLIEAVQVTDSLFGVGVSFGGLVGTLSEAAHSAALFSQGTDVRVNAQPLLGKYAAIFNEPLGRRSPGELLVTRQASLVLASAPAILSRPEEFDDDTVLLTMAGYTAAMDTVYRFLRGYAWQDTFAQATEDRFAAPLALDAFTVETLAADGVAIPEAAAWAAPGTPAFLTGNEYAEQVGIPAAQAMKQWIEDRRQTPAGTFAAACQTACIEMTLYALEEDEGIIHWQMGTDARLAGSLSEEGLLVDISAPPETLWKFWTAARELIESRGKTYLTAPQWRQLADTHGITLIPTLPPTAPWPSEWSEVLGSSRLEQS